MAAPPPVFSDLFDDASKWDEPAPDYDALILLLGGVASTAHGAPALYDRAQMMSGLANLARRSPTLIAFCPADVVAHARMRGGRNPAPRTRDRDVTR